MNKIMGIIKADWNLRKEYYVKYPMDIIKDMALRYALGFIICAWIIRSLIEYGYHPELSIILVIVAYWSTSIFWGWRIIRAIRRF